MARLSKAEQDELVEQLVSGMETMDGDAWDELRAQLDDEHKSKSLTQQEGSLMMR